MKSKPVHKTNNLFLRFIANNICSPLFSFFLKFYMKWGTTYKIDDWESEDDPFLERLGSDYDENNVPYWEKWEHQEDKDKKDGTQNSAIKKDMDK